MNKHFYRIIFNKARGMLMVVAEIVKSHQGSSRSSQKAKYTTVDKNTTAALKPVAFMTYIALGLICLSATSYANTIVVDKNADKTQRPIIMPTANGATQVNITAPSGAGVSHNKFTQFDVSEKGVILNNSHKASQTELAGYIKGNDLLLKSGSAKVILNEINSKHASQLNGYIEVAGQKAQVVIANAAGITCNGCGFINANRATLTTGKPILENGELKGYLVEQGNIAINGKGLNSAKQDYTDLIAQTVNINASLWANDVKVVAGRNNVNQDVSQITKLTDNDQASPQLAIDVAALGGMYAGKIQLVGTQTGVGVHNSGQLGASAGNITITADGKIVNTGSIQAKGDITLTSQQDITNSKQLYSQKNIKITSQKQINNQATIVAQNDITLNANTIVSDSTSTIAAGIDDKGKLTQQGNITANAKDIALQGKNLASQNISIQGVNNVNLANSKTTAKSLTVTGENIDVNSSNLNIDNGVLLTARDTINSNNSQVKTNGKLVVKADTITNNQAKISAKQGIELSAKNIENNQSQLASLQDIQLTANYTLNNTEAKIFTKESINLEGDTIINDESHLFAEGNLTIEAKQLSNQKSLLESKGDTVINSEMLLNKEAKLITDGSISINAQTLNNKQAELSAKGNISIISDVKLDNDQAKVMTEKTLSIKANTATNNQADLQAKGNISIIGQIFNNSNSLLVAGKNIKIQSAQFDNQSTIIKSNGNIEIEAKQFNNNNAQLTTNDNISIKSENLNNQSAQLNAVHGIAVQSSLFDNQQAKLVTSGKIDILATDVNNQAANLTAQDSINIKVMGNLNNHQAELFANNDITIDVYDLDNTNATVKNQGKISIDAKDIDNTQAKLTANQIAIHAQDLQNNKADMIANQLANIDARKIINTDATISAGNIDITATSLTGDGELQAKHDLTLNLQDSLINQKIIIANDKLSITTSNDIENRGQILSGQSLVLNSNTLTNQHQGELESETIFINGNQLINNGLINGGNISVNLTGRFDNNHAARFYGDVISITANELNNKAMSLTADITPTLAARESLTLNVETLNNYNKALILSLGELNIDAITINNHSARIESVGNMDIKAGTINNMNDLIETEDVLIETKHVTEYSPIGKTVRYQSDEIKTYRTSKNHNYLTLEALDGSFKDYQFYKYDYNSDIYQTQITNTNPAQIIAGHDLIINADYINNDNSQIIAGNTLHIQYQTLDNISFQGTERVENLGTVTYYDRKKRKKKPGQNRKWSQKSSTSPYKDIITTTIDLANAKIEDKTIINSSQLTDNQRNTVDVTVNNNNTSIDSDSGKNNPDFSQGILVNNTKKPVEAVSIVEPNTSLPNNSIYIVNKDADKNYLVETDPKFTNRNKWLSSDYMFKQLKVDPNNIQKRLGDGYYEQQLIREQVVTLTGQRYVGDYTSDIQQYQALMNAGVAFGQHYGLSIGVELSQEQMMLLTTDIVWMVSKEVTIDGVTYNVLAPQVYVVNRPHVTAEGALLAGKNIKLDGQGDLNSSGSILAKNSADILANNFNNEGTIAGGEITIRAKENINSNGSLIGDKLVSLSANKDINLISTTSTNEINYGANKSITTVVDKVSSIQVKDGDIKLNSGRDVNLDAALIINNATEGKTDITAGHDIHLSTISTKTLQDTIWGKDNYRKIDIEEVVGSEIFAKGDINFNAGHDISIKAGNISAEKGLNLFADNDIDINSDVEHKELVDHQKVKWKGTLSKGSNTTHIEIDDITQKGSSLSGDDVSIRAGNDLSVTGSQVIGTNDVNFTVGNDVTIDAAQESYYNYQQTIKEKSGLMSSGGLGFTIGKEKSNLKQKDNEQAFIGSTIGSTEANVNISAGKDINVTGSDIIAKKDINLTGDNVTIDFNDAQTTYKEEYKYEKSGLTVAITGTAAEIYDAIQAMERAKEKGNDKLLALQSIKSGLTGVQAMQDLVLKNKEGQTEASIGVSLMAGTQKTEREVNQEQHSVIGSGVSAGQNITITATGNAQKEEGDITLKGSEVRAGNDITLDANRDLNVIGAVNTQHSDSDEKSYGGAVGIQFQIGGDESGFRVKGNANFSRERENADGSAWSESVINAGNTLTTKTGNDTTIIGGQLNGDTVKMDVGNNLNIQSLQDTDNYDYDKISASVSGSGGMGGFSANLALSKTDIESNWASVTDQSGIFAGKGGFDITVGNNTDLQGAVIASSAEDKTHNQLDTGTISFSNIENKADFDVSSMSMSIGTSGGPSPTAGMPTIYHNSGHDHSTTASAVEDGSLTVRNQDEQQQNINQLSRDTANANNPLAQLFNKQKELDKIEAIELVRDIAAQAKSIANKYDRIQAQNDINDNPAKLDELRKSAQDEYDSLPPEEKAGTSVDKLYANNYYTAVSDQVSHNKDNKNLGGMGSSLSKGIDAATSIVTGLITGDITGGLAGASAPYLANIIKESTYERDSNNEIIYENGEPKVNKAANLTAHALLGAAIAIAQGNSALAGGAGALAGEAAADFIREKLYNKDVKDLSEADKENISALAQLAVGLAVAAGTGGNTSDIGTAVAGSKNAVENNFLSLNEAVREKYLNKKNEDGTITDVEQKELIDIQKKDQASNERVISACENSGSEACLNEQKLVHAAKDSYAGFAEYGVHYNLQSQYPEQMAQYGILIGDYTKEVIGLVEKGYSVDGAKAYIDNQIATDKAYAEKYQQAMDSLPNWAKTWMVIEDTVNLVYGAKQAGVSLKQLNNQGLANTNLKSGGANTGEVSPKNQNQASAPVTKVESPPMSGESINVPKAEHTGKVSDSTSVVRPQEYASSPVAKPIVTESGFAGKGTGAATQANSKYSGGLVQVNKPDAAADALAQRIGGESRVRFANDVREFDTISDMYIAQTKPALQQVNKSVRDQMKATFEAAKDTNRSVYYHFEGQPSQSVINKLNEYSKRYGVKVVIDTKPLNPK